MISSERMGVRQVLGGFPHKAFAARILGRYGVYRSDYLGFISLVFKEGTGGQRGGDTQLQQFVANVQVQVQGLKDKEASTPVSGQQVLHQLNRLLDNRLRPVYNFHKRVVEQAAAMQEAAGFYFDAARQLVKSPGLAGPAMPYLYLVTRPPLRYRAGEAPEGSRDGQPWVETNQVFRNFFDAVRDIAGNTVWERISRLGERLEAGSGGVLPPVFKYAALPGRLMLEAQKTLSRVGAGGRPSQPVAQGGPSVPEDRRKYSRTGEARASDGGFAQKKLLEQMTRLGRLFEQVARLGSALESRLRSILTDIYRKNILTGTGRDGWTGRETPAGLMELRGLPVRLPGLLPGPQGVPGLPGQPGETGEWTTERGFIGYFSLLYNFLRHSRGTAGGAAAGRGDRQSPARVDEMRKILKEYGHYWYTGGMNLIRPLQAQRAQAARMPGAVFRTRTGLIREEVSPGAGVQYGSRSVEMSLARRMAVPGEDRQRETAERETVRHYSHTVPMDFKASLKSRTVSVEEVRNLWKTVQKNMTVERQNIANPQISRNDIEKIADRVYYEIEKKVRLERQRRGL